MGNFLKAKVTKTEYFDVKYKYGCCSAIDAGFYVNEQVANPARTTNGVYVELSANALQAIQRKMEETKGQPVRVVMEVPCCGGGCACCSGGGCACLQECNDPVDARGVQYTELWFATKSADSKCSGMTGCLANRFCAHLPHFFSIACIPTVAVLPHEVNGIDPAIRYCSSAHAGAPAAGVHLEGLKIAGRPPVGQYNVVAPTFIAAAQMPAAQAMQ